MKIVSPHAGFTAVGSLLFPSVRHKIKRRADAPMRQETSFLLNSAQGRDCSHSIGLNLRFELNLPQWHPFAFLN